MYMAKNGEGKTRISNLDEIMIKGLTLYPNPSSGQVQGSLISNARQIDVLDIVGKCVMHTASPGQSLDLSILPKGQFFLKVLLVDGNQRIQMVQVD